MNRHAFTLVELLIVIAVIAVLSVVVILILNPAETLRQSRDSNRVSDLSTLKTALAFYETQGGSSLGNASTSYVSIFDSVATSSAGDQCQGLSLPSLPTSWSYHCAASSSYKNIDGTGWIPVNFSASQLKPPIAQLPVDPVNTASTGYYFTYTTNGTTYEMTASLESQKYASTTAVDGGQYADLYETGSNLVLAPYDYGGGAGMCSGHNGYSCSRAITMSGSAVSGTLSNFPMLFSGTYAYLAASSSAGSVQNPNGYDIVFASNSGCSSKLNFEQESYTSSTGNIIDWVNVPSITGGTVIYLCYGNGSTTTSQQNASATWNANYAQVYHFPNGTALTVNDSTADNANGTTHGSPTATTGEVDGAANFSSASSQYVSMANQVTSGNSITISGWIKTASPSNYAVILDTRQNGTAWGCALFLDFAASNHAAWYCNNTSQQDGSANLADGNWHYLTGTLSGGTTQALYVDGQLITSATVSSFVGFTGGTSLVGAAENGGGTPTIFTDGAVDEVRVSNVARSSQWILTEYNNQSSPSAFYTVGSAM